jgi:cystathionine beta-lyase/cystathionine gamma-synthase
MERACATARHVAEQLSEHRAVTRVTYPGLETDADHPVAMRLFEPGKSGNMVTFQLRGGRESVASFIAQTPEIPFCPSLGEVSTTLSHPASTSHRSLSATEREALGIADGTIRLSVGTESTDWVWQSLKLGLDSLL